MIDTALEVVLWVAAVAGALAVLAFLLGRGP
jgi:hypothetical protein